MIAKQLSTCCPTFLDTGGTFETDWLRTSKETRVGRTDTFQQLQSRTRFTSCPLPECVGARNYEYKGRMLLDGPLVEADMMETPQDSAQ